MMGGVGRECRWREGILDWIKGREGDGEVIEGFEGRLIMDLIGLGGVVYLRRGGYLIVWCGGGGWGWVGEGLGSGRWWLCGGCCGCGVVVWCVGGWWGGGGWVGGIVMLGVIGKVCVLEMKKNDSSGGMMGNVFRVGEVRGMDRGSLGVLVGGYFVWWVVILICG